MVGGGGGGGGEGGGEGGLGEGHRCGELSDVMEWSGDRHRRGGVRRRAERGGRAGMCRMPYFWLAVTIEQKARAAVRRHSWTKRMHAGDHGHWRGRRRERGEEGAWRGGSIEKEGAA